MEKLIFMAILLFYDLMLSYGYIKFNCDNKIVFFVILIIPIAMCLIGGLG